MTVTTAYPIMSAGRMEIHPDELSFAEATEQAVPFEIDIEFIKDTRTATKMCSCVVDDDNPYGT